LPRRGGSNVYLKAVLNADPRIESLLVGGGDVTVHVKNPKWLPRTRFVKISLTPPVRQFVVAFDEGVYPDLLRNDAKTAAWPERRGSPA
jgi:hypothetical protein